MLQSYILCIFITCVLIFEISALHQPGCGRIKAMRVAGGSQAQYMEFPWIASLQSFNRHDCTGSIITPKFILLAAHCIDIDHMTISYGKKIYKIRGSVIVGAGNFKQANEEYRVSHKIQAIYTHPFYTKGHKYDIALVKLFKPINLGPNSPYSSICLPRRIDKYDNLMTVAGWGCTKLSKEQLCPYSNVLMKTYLPRINLETCLKEAKKIMDINYKVDWICAYHKSKSTCPGDCGGPAMCRNKKNSVVHVCGVSTFSLNSGFSVFTSVIEYTKWITRVVNQGGN